MEYNIEKVKLTLIQVALFVAKWKRLGLTDEDLQALERQIMDDPHAGKLMRGTGGVRKVRFAPPSWHSGKSGAARVCYVAFSTAGAVCLLTIFGKNEQANLTAGQQAQVRALVGAARRTIET